MSFLAISPSVDHIEYRPLAEISENSDQPLVYMPDKSLEKLSNDIIKRCTQNAKPNKIVVLPAKEVKSLMQPNVIRLSGVLVKLIHFNQRVIGNDLLADLYQMQTTFRGIPVIFLISAFRTQIKVT